MEDFSTQLNVLLVDTFNSILRMEESMLKSAGGANLSIGEMHLLEAVGKGDPEGCTISSLARERSVTLPSDSTAAKAVSECLNSAAICCITPSSSECSGSTTPA